MADVDPRLRARRDQILREMSARESPRIMLLFVAIIVLFDLGYALIGIIPPLSYYVSDLIQVLVLLISSILILRGVIPPRWSPAVFAGAVVVNNLALNFQYTLIGYSAVGVILLVMAAYGAVTLMWRPFLISAGIMAVVTSYTLVVNDPENGPGWVVTMFTALAVSGVLLYGRQHGARALAQANLSIEELATRDALTGLFNRHGLQEAVGTVESMAARMHQPLFAVFVDITGLKQVNDRHGHAAGDLVITRAAKALKEHCRASDVLCRWGGDEFVAVGVGEAPDAAHFAKRVEAEIDTTGLEGIWEPSIWAGVAESSGGQVTVDELIHLADEEMYRARERAASRAREHAPHEGR